MNILLQRASDFSVCQLVLYPQNYSCPIVAERVDGTDVIWGGQNIYPQSSGPYTGENSPTLLKTMKAHTVLIGHSERRLLFDERDDLIAQKMWASTQAGLVPLLCVGETIEEYHFKQTKDIVARQIQRDVHSFIKELLASMNRSQIPVLYGGSVKPDNAKNLATGKHIDGFLVGGASLKIESFLDIAKALETIKSNRL